MIPIDIKAHHQVAHPMVSTIWIMLVLMNKPIEESDKSKEHIRSIDPLMLKEEEEKEQEEQ